MTPDERRAVDTLLNTLDSLVVLCGTLREAAGASLDAATVTDIDASLEEARGQVKGYRRKLRVFQEVH